MDIRIITQGGVLGNRGHRGVAAASCVSHGLAPPVPLVSLSGYLFLDPPFPYIKHRGAIIVTPGH